MSQSHPGLTPPAKVTPQHLQRLAYIYVRQSSPKQVRQNLESQMYQAQLSQRARELGWAAEQIRVLDSDLGLSGQSSAERGDFQELVAEVSLGHVGIIFGHQASRLARNNHDWYHLLDLAALRGTLLADSDGIYDPRAYNDRLLLGLKGTMSEAELYLLRQRLDAGRMNQVLRGAYRQRLPTGYLRLSDQRVVQDPDAQVRHVLELLFAKFEELGSAEQVVRYLRTQQILLPRRQSAGPQAGELLWKVASKDAVTDILHNPAYAGAFAYGRNQRDPTRQQPGRPASGQVHKPLAEWLHLQHDVYPAYISWEQYLANQERLRQNALRFAEVHSIVQGISRNGSGLLQGLALCGQCSHRLRTVYKGPTPRYICGGLARTAATCQGCTSVRAATVDTVVVEAFFAALQPAQLDALDALLRRQQEERQRLERHWQEHLGRAQYEVQLAQRQYDAVDPDNRLVALELERRWEDKLRHLQQREEAYAHFQRTPLPEGVPAALQDTFRALGEQLPLLWPRLTNAQRKELLRSLIRQVILKRPAADQVGVRIVWVSGCYTDYVTWTGIPRAEGLPDYERLVQRVEELWRAGYNDVQMAEQLTREGFHSARAAHVLPSSIRTIRQARGWRIRNGSAWGPPVAGYVRVAEFAQQLGVNVRTVYDYMEQQLIPPEAVSVHPLTGIRLIQDDPHLLHQLQQHLANPARRHGRGRPRRAALEEGDPSEGRPPVAPPSESGAPQHAPRRAEVRVHRLYPEGSDPSLCVVGSPEWFAWLEEATTFRYYTTKQLPIGQGHQRAMRPISLRKEQRRRNGFYWCAYLRTHGQLYKRYVGRSEALTTDKLDEIATILNELW